jgi:polar amino acid transport system substrate-binding protein
MSASRKLIVLPMTLLVFIGVVLSSCRPSGDLLSQIRERGTIRISTDTNYAPQSEQVPNAQRMANTLCAADQLTANQLQGFDIGVAVEIARRLNVEPCFVAPTWETIVAGDWGGRWDISVGSMTITRDRQEKLWFTPAYYFAPAQLAAKKGSGIASVNDVAGKAVCVGTGTTYEDYFNGKLTIPDSDVKVKAPAGVKVVALNTDAECAQAIQAGRTEFEALMTAGNVVDQAIADGVDIEKIGTPVYVENLAVAIDKKSPIDPRSLLDAIGKIINDMHADGTLKTISMKWFGMDRTVAP